MNVRALSVVLVSLLVAASATAGAAPQPTTASAPLYGWVDMHTHPMSHLAFGGKLLHGAPDLNILMPAIPKPGEAGCWHYVPATTREQASREDRAIHGGYGLFDNWCGDTLRKEFIRGLEGELGAQTKHQEEAAFGYPDYNFFPAHNDLTHQQMWIGWIHRAYAGGLRVMVALAVNNRTLAAAVSGSGDVNPDDAASAAVQIAQMHVLVGQNPWMEIAYTPADVRRIVGDGKLAIVLGVEIDNIGNMQWNAGVSATADQASRDFVAAQLQALHAQGVRYIFPVHVVDNKFGGTAIYQDQFNTSNLHQNGTWWDIGCAPLESLIDHRFVVSGFDLAYAIIKLKIGIDPFAAPPTPPECTNQGDSGGHANNKDLTPLGEFAIEEMMRMGMLIDIDHMSAQSTAEALAIAESHKYPINAGHNGPRVPSWGSKTEYEKMDTDYSRISTLGGMVGLGSGEKASDYVRAWQYVRSFVNGNQLAIGTDANGMVILPGPDPAASVTYDATFPRLTDGSRTWDIGIDGVANYGLFADYVRSWSSVGMTAAQKDEFFSTAEGFARMWERVAVAQATMIPTPPTASAGGPYSVDEGSSVTLDASGTTDPNQTTASLTYEWDFDSDGTYDDATGIAPSYAAIDGPATVTLHLRVTDSDAMTGTATATVTVINVAPSATLVQLPPAMILQGLSASFEFTSISDPGTADVAAGFDFSVDCTDDGVYDSGPSASPAVSCSYPVAGAFTVRGRIADKDGGASESTVTITVLTPAQAADAIAAMIAATPSLNAGQKNALLAKLDQAIDLLEAGHTDQALNELQVLLRQVQTFDRVGVLTPAQTAELMFWIQQLISSIEAV